MRLILCGAGHPCSVSQVLISLTESPSDKIDAFHGHIGAAAEWIFICGRRLYNERESVRGHWPQWQQNLEWIIGQDGLKDESRTLCEEVLVEMRNIMNP